MIYSYYMEHTGTVVFNSVSMFIHNNLRTDVLVDPPTWHERAEELI